MKLLLLAALSGLVAASTASFEQAVALRGSAAEAVMEYSPPEPTKDTDLRALWDQLAAEAAFMQVQISEGRSYEQCVESCDNSKEVNRARCRRNCDQIDDKGGSSTSRTFNCDDCRTLASGGRSRERCMTACREDQVNNVEKCLDARDCVDCRRDCGTGVALDMCLEDFNCPLADNRKGRSCSSANTCGECNSFCDSGRDIEDCRDSVGCNGRNSSNRKDYSSRGGNRKGNNGRNGRSYDDCDRARTCKECKEDCSGSDKKDCQDDYCSAEELAEIEAAEKLGGVFVQE